MVKHHKKGSSLSLALSRICCDLHSSILISRVSNSGLKLVQFGTQFAQRLGLNRAGIGSQILYLERIVFQVIQFFSSTAGEPNQFVLRIPNRFGFNHFTLLASGVCSAFENFGVSETPPEHFPLQRRLQTLPVNVLELRSRDRRDGRGDVHTVHQSSRFPSALSWA